MNKEKKAVTDAAGDPRDEAVPRRGVRETRPDSDVTPSSEAAHDEAIEEAVEGIHG